VSREILILRDPRESRRKCSLTPLRGTEGVRFVNYHPDRVLDAGGRILLDPDGPVLTAEDAGKGLLLVDCSWRRVPTLLRTVRGELISRSVPPLITAYPRHSNTFDDPSSGLASIEALYAAVAILTGPCPELLDGYLWREEFLASNPIIAG
jgi:pre-rRNA-processing protein TSR3